MADVDESLGLASLAEFLANDYGKLRLYMGVSAFNRMVHLCAANVPSDSSAARTLSQRLPTFLNVTRPYSKSPELSELASVERAFNAALDAPDAPILDRTAYPEGFGKVRVDIHPSVQRLLLRTNATSIWAALTAGELPPPPGRLGAPQELLVWRQGLTSRFRMIGREEALALDEAACGKLTSVDQRSANFLRGWLEAEVISAVRDINDVGEK
jgi:hypothetical protein